MPTLELSALNEINLLAEGKPNEFHVLARIEFPLSAQSVQRPPIHLALVLDRSGSMAGQKLELTKRAATYFMQWLTRRDFLTVITYDDTVDVLVPHTPLTGKQMVAAKIDSIQSGGQTNLSGGWMRGLSELHEHRQPGHLLRLILLTDGQANAGITAPAQLAEIAGKNREREIATTAIGFGAGFDETLLKSIAERGGGRFHFVAEAEGMGKAFQDEFGELATIVAQNVELEVAINDGVSVVDVVSDLPHEKVDRRLKIALDDARAGDVRQVLLKLRTGEHCAGNVVVIV